MYQWLGAHIEERDGIVGTRFAVWAPNAREVSVVCDQNGWTHGRNPLHPSDSGVWSGFVEGIGHGDIYKYSIVTCDGRRVEKADPYAFYSELRPKSASIVY
ncbi:MAG: 1,4-alpha-glucan branching enzyme, partial [Planctomycetes bacterium]|nr:1,4-alpha-glucan branching enzyme [Planctomycetota bacterium]